MFFISKMKRNDTTKNNDKCCKDQVFDDFLNDVENDIKMEKYEEIWRKYQKHIKFFASLVLGCIVLFTLWQRYDTNRREEMAMQFINAQFVAEGGSLDKAATMMKVLSSKGHKGYSTFAKLSRASMLAELDFNENISEIKEIYKSLYSSNKSPAYVKTLSRLLFVNTSLQELGDNEVTNEWANEMLALLKKCDKDDGGFSLIAKELEGLIYYKIKDFKNARESFDYITKNENTPNDMRMRVSIMIQAIQNQLSALEEIDAGGKK